MNKMLKETAGNPVQSYHHGDLRAALVAQARKIVEQDGPDRVSLREVAKSVGVSRAAPYHHFKDKQALLSAVAASGFREFAALLAERALGWQSARERLDNLGVGYIEYALDHKQMFRLMQGPALQTDSNSDELAQARQASYLPLNDAVAACLPGASQAQLKTACAAAWSMVHGMATLCNDGRLQSIIDISDIKESARRIIAHLDISSVLQK